MGLESASEPPKPIFRAYFRPKYLTPASRSFNLAYLLLLTLYIPESLFGRIYKKRPTSTTNFFLIQFNFKNIKYKMVSVEKVNVQNCFKQNALISKNNKSKHKLLKLKSLIFYKTKVLFPTISESVN